MAKDLSQLIDLSMDAIVSIHNRNNWRLSYFNRCDILSTACGGRFYAPNGVITSPRYPNHYLPNANCVYVVRVPSGKQIQLNVKTFELEHSSGCNYDSLEIRQEDFALESFTCNNLA